jgi:hypothetical protein
VQFKVVEWHYADYDASFRGCLKSFKRVERTESLGAPVATAAGGQQIATRADLLALPADQRPRALKDAVEAKLRHETGAVPAGWKNRRTKQFLALYNADEKFVRAAIDHAEAVASHLEDFFGPAGAGYVPPAILRIFASAEEASAYGSGKSDGFVREIVVGAGHGWEKDNAWEELNRNLWSEWMSMRHPGLEETLPKWFRDGLQKYMNMLRTKGKRVSFAHDDWDRDEIRLQIKKGNYDPLLALLSVEFADEGIPNKAVEPMERERQIRVVVLWLMRQGNTGRSKNLVKNLVLAVAAEMDRVEEQLAKAAAETKAAAPPTLASERPAILKAGWRSVFAEWDEGDWNRLTNSWLSHAK